MPAAVYIINLDAYHINSHWAREAHFVCSLSKVGTSPKEKNKAAALLVSEQRKSCRNNG